MSVPATAVSFTVTPTYPALATDNAPRDALIDGLNLQQREAVTAPIGHRLVVAGPGSGKTRVLTHRIAWLVERERAPASSILAVTFTRKAANEIRQRLDGLIDGAPHAIDTGTFHSVSVRWLHRFSEEAGLKADFRVLDADDQRKVLRDLLKGFKGKSGALLTPGKAQDWINHQKESGLRWRGVAPAPAEIDELQRALYHDYERYCTERDLVDFPELVLRCVELLRTGGLLAMYVHSRYRHLLVDEFQDTNAVQYQWTRLVAGERATLFAVGDDDQAIYGWRGADSNHMLALPDVLPGVAVTQLERNYRSTGNVVRAAHGLIANNATRFGKTLWTNAAPGSMVFLRHANDEKDEAEFIARNVSRYIDDGGSANDIAVLYRANHVALPIEQAFLRHHLPYAIRHGHAFLERAEVKDSVAWMRLVVDPDDNLAFARASQTPPSGIGQAVLRKVTGASAGSSWRATAVAVKGAAGVAAGDFADRIDRLRERVTGLAVPQQVESIVTFSGLREHHAKDSAHRVDNLDELPRLARAYVDGADGANVTLDGFLEYLVLEADSEDGGGGKPKVQFLTLHAAKGLEFPVVFMAAMENGIIPDRRSDERPGGFEEERRLAYVGMTRAREYLALSWAAHRTFRGRSNACEPSPFLGELPGDALERSSTVREH